MRSTGKLSSHLRHNLVGYVAVFIALSGTAYAARPMITGADIENGSITDTDINAANKDGAAATPSLRTLGTGARQAMPGNATPGGSPSGSAGGDLTGTYPNPSIAANAVDSGKVSDDSLTGTDVDESSLGKVDDADKLDGFDSADYGAVMAGRINGLTSVGAQAGSPSGISTGSFDTADVSTITPDQDLRVRDFSVQLTAAPGLGAARTFSVQFAGFHVLGCIITNDATTCQNSGPGNLPIPANSEFWIREDPVIGDPAHADARFAFRLTP